MRSTEGESGALDLREVPVTVSFKRTRLKTYQSRVNAAHKLASSISKLRLEMIQVAKAAGLLVRNGGEQENHLRTG